MQQPIDLGMVLGNTLANLSWTGFTFVCAVILVGALWCILPFAVFGVKRRLDAIEMAQRQQTELLITELRRSNELLAKRANGLAATAHPESWNGVPQVPYSEQPAVRPPVATSFRAHRAGAAPQQANGGYVPYPDDPRPAQASDGRWGGLGRRLARGSAA